MNRGRRESGPKLGLRIVLLGLVAGGVAGCAASRPGLGPGEVAAGEVLEERASRIEATRSVRAAGRVSVTQAGNRFEAEHLVFFQNPGRYRIEIESKPLFGLLQASAIALAEGDSLVVYSPSHGVLFESSGVADLEFLTPELRWMAMANARGLLLGLPDVSSTRPTSRTLRPGREGLYEMCLEGNPGSQTLWLEPGTLSLRRMEIRDGSGTLLAESTYEYASGEAVRPKRVQVKCPASDAVILLTYYEFDLNAPIDPGVFHLDVPASVHRFRPGDRGGAD